MPKAGFGEGVHQAINDGYEDYIKQLNWQSIPPTIQQVEEECRKQQAEFILREQIRYIIIDRKNDQVLGRCAFPAVQAKWEIPQFGISYFIRKTQRSKGYATEASHAMAKIAFEILKAKKVEIYCAEDNIASSKIPLKLGFKLEYTQKGGWVNQEGNLVEVQTYSIFSEQDLPNWKVVW